jgi:hypothetical protein
VLLEYNNQSRTTTTARLNLGVTMGGVFGSTVHLQTVVCSTFLGPLLPSRDVKAFLDVLVRQPIVNNTMEPINKLFFVVLSGEVINKAK